MSTPAAPTNVCHNCGRAAPPAVLVECCGEPMCERCRKAALIHGHESEILRRYNEVDPTAVTDWLSAALAAWTATQKLPFECADDLLTTRKGLTPDQREWLTTFAKLWDMTNA